MMQSSSGDGYHYEDGWLIVHNPGSGQLCNPGGLSGWIETMERNRANTRKAERSTAQAELRRQEAADKAALGEVFGALATLIRKRRAEAAKLKKSPPSAPKRSRRRRHLSAD